MDMQGSRQLAVTQQQAWEALNDPEILKRCITGCEKFEASAENVYSIVVAIRIGPVSARFNGKVTLADIVMPQSYSLKFDAQGGAAGFGKGESQVQLIPNETGVELRYTVKSTVGGKLAQIGQRLIDGVAKSLAEEFFARFEAALVERFLPAASSTPAEPEEAQATGAASPSSGDAPPQASGVSAPTPTPAWVWLAAIGAAFLAGWFLGGR